EWGKCFRSDSARQPVPPNNGSRKFDSESGDRKHDGGCVAGIFTAVNLAMENGWCLVAALCERRCQ
ncbi:MAG: hypothetical protein ABI600_04980, partial [Luteolibacter sp.]